MGSFVLSLFLLSNGLVWLLQKTWGKCFCSFHSLFFSFSSFFFFFSILLLFRWWEIANKDTQFFHVLSFTLCLYSKFSSQGIKAHATWPIQYYSPKMTWSQRGRERVWDGIERVSSEWVFVFFLFYSEFIYRMANRSFCWNKSEKILIVDTIQRLLKSERVRIWC